MKGNLELYRIFCTVARAGNISRAGEELFLNQPSISKAIKALESQMGCTLFLRGRRGVTLTPEGEKLFNEIYPAYDRIARAENLFSSREYQRQSPIRIVCSPYATDGPLPGIFQAFYEETENRNTIELQVEEVSRSAQIVRECGADFGLIASPWTYSDKLTCISLYREDFIMAAGPKFAALREGEYTLPQLMEYPHVGVRSNLVKDTHDFFYIKNDAPYEMRVTVNNGVDVVHLLEHNLGIGLIPRDTARESLSMGKIFEVRLKDLHVPLPSIEVCLVQNPAHTLSSAAGVLKSRILFAFRK